MSINFQLGLLHFVHLMIYTDVETGTGERTVLASLKEEEGISDYILEQFERKVSTSPVQRIFHDGVTLLNRCSEEERLCAFIHLYRLAGAENNVCEKEIRLLLYALDDTQIEFDEIVAGAQLVAVQRTPNVHPQTRQR